MHLDPNEHAMRKQWRNVWMYRMKVPRATTIANIKAFVDKWGAEGQKLVDDTVAALQTDSQPVVENIYPKQAGDRQTHGHRRQYGKGH